MSGEQQNTMPEGGLPPADLGAAFDVAGTRRGRLAAVLPPSGTTAAERPERKPEPEARRTDPAPERQAEQRPEPADAEMAGGVDQDAAQLVDVDENDQVDNDASPAPGRAATKPVILYMPTQLRARLRRAAVGSTQLDVILDAVERTESDGILGRLVREHQQPDVSGLFERTTARGSESQVQVNVRARRQHITVLDKLAARYSTNRSELVRVALDEVLPGGSRRRR
ncbi:MAG TPA: hypothetical protein VGL05_30165 [Kribbella sp.]